jgi:hypothetical protein
VTGIVDVHDRELHAEHGHSHMLDSQIEEVQVGKKRQIVGILVSITLAQSARKLIHLLGVTIRHYDTFRHHRSNISNHSGPRVQCVVLFPGLIDIEYKFYCSVTARGNYFSPAF